jgi:hypothetical protein
MMSDANNTQRKAGASTLISNEIYFNSKKWGRRENIGGDEAIWSIIHEYMEMSKQKLLNTWKCQGKNSCISAIS